MVIDWSPRAQRNFDALISYIKARSPRGAKRVADRIVKRIGDLVDMPEQGAPLPKGLRRLNVSRTHYLVIYRVRGDVVEIVAILHGQQERRS